MHKCGETVESVSTQRRKELYLLKVLPGSPKSRARDLKETKKKSVCGPLWLIFAWSSVCKGDLKGSRLGGLFWKFQKMQCVLCDRLYELSKIIFKAGILHFLPSHIFLQVYDVCLN